MTYQGKVISGDCHIDIPWLPSDLFVSNAPLHLKDKMPYVMETSEGKQWFVDGKLLGWVAGSSLGLTPWGPYVPGISDRLDRMAKTDFFSDGQKGMFHPTTPELRIKDQEIDGVSGEVIYGVLGLAGVIGSVEVLEGAATSRGGDAPGAGYGVTDPEAITAVYDIYNEWLAEFCKSSPDRFAGLACLNGNYPEKAANQLRHAARLGLKGAEMNVATALKPLYHSDWDSLWEAASEAGLPISFHTIGLSARLPEKSDFESYQWVYDGVDSALFQLAGAEYMASIIFSGACDRFPDLKFVLGECGVGWIPFMLHRLDEQFEKQYHNVLDLRMKPSEYWRRQGCSTFQHEFITSEMVSLIGEDNIIWGSDYPHPDGIWPDSRKLIDENLGHLDNKNLRKIVCENTARLYAFPN